MLGIQVDEGPERSEDDLTGATVHHRLLPGDGAFDSPAIWAHRDIGACPRGVEVFSDELHHRGRAAAAVGAAEAARRVLESVSPWRRRP